MKQFIYALAILMVTISCNSQTTATEGYRRVDNETWRLEMAKYEGSMPQIVDVRTPDEFAEGNLSGSVNIDFYSPDFMTDMEKLDKENTLYIYCRSGGRSAKAAAMLQNAGFKSIIELEHGYSGYK